MEKDKTLLEVIIKELVESPFTIDRRVDEMGVLLTLGVAQEDMGKVIGREGNMAKAIRTVLRGVGMKNGSHVNLKILEPEGSTHFAPKY